MGTPKKKVPQPSCFIRSKNSTLSGMGIGICPSHSEIDSFVRICEIHLSVCEIAFGCDIFSSKMLWKNVLSQCNAIGHFII